MQQEEKLHSVPMSERTGIAPSVVHYQYELLLLSPKIESKLEDKEAMVVLLLDLADELMVDTTLVLAVKLSCTLLLLWCQMRQR